MADDDSFFDASVKKKKKGKKQIDLTALENEEGKETTDKNVESIESNIKDNELDDLTGLLNAKKKKKGKKKAFNMEDVENALNEVGESVTDTVDRGDSGVGAGNDGEVVEDEDLDFNLPKKKKKKKKIHFEESEPTEEAGADEGEAAFDEADKDCDVDTNSASVNAVSTSGPVAWANSDRDYTYEELLQHVFNIIKEKNPDIIAGEKKRLVMRPPQVLRVGTKKTSFANFIDICKSLHRQPRHMQSFLLAELGTSGSVDANNQLIIKGRFQQKQIESVLRRYIKEYVACQTCRSPETLLQKDTRLFFLQCETCGSRRSVASIKSGFQAVTGKRAAIRAKAV
ncbi:eukaryotic translation initiation factor 2 subunit 2-like protein [Leptotrombidium deliense]|uniref:Eukaryotic translation initiation factor 2 subunit 2 n=1 Tax=Leptotrombidium deliense TaxID=299467 RepID=A0A443SFD0_9ACAR|nr:eukaryotic translation initiation factor 2 subunit 2-like protein [Leptotrombidium deliense]